MDGECPFQRQKHFHIVFHDFVWFSNTLPRRVRFAFCITSTPRCSMDIHVQRVIVFVQIVQVEGTEYSEGTRRVGCPHEESRHQHDTTILHRLEWLLIP